MVGGGISGVMGVLLVGCGEICTGGVGVGGGLVECFGRRLLVESGAGN